MPFRLFYAPSAFQAIINDILFPFLDSYIVFYLDDILIFSADLAPHKAYFLEVVGKLRENYLLCKLEKYELF